MLTSPPFQFKQFSVSQNKCAMKVNTDGVLLGAWQQAVEAVNILDIGTGTGVIALMMAQTNPVALIDAIDIDADAYLQAKENFEQSPWSDRLTAHHISLQDKCIMHGNVQRKYDFIISNPPYFIDDQKTNNDQKNIAKHSVALTYTELLSGISQLLAPHGKAFLVLPAFNFSLFETEAALHHLFVTQLTDVIALEGKPPYLALLQLERQPKEFSKTDITIQNTKGKFTDAYKKLTKDFYLKF